MKAASKFRFVKFHEEKIKFDELRISDPSPTSHSITCSAKFVAVPYGGTQASAGRICVIDHTAKFTPNADPPLIQAHGDTVNDLAFSYFNHDLLATASKDTTVKVRQRLSRLATAHSM